MDAYKNNIKNWPEEERPREKLLKFGEHNLTNTELLAILLRTGYKGKSAVDLAREILVAFGSFRNLSHTDQRDWKQFKGLGNTKLAQIKAAIEIGRRFISEEKQTKGNKIRSSQDAVDIFMPRMRDLKKEVFKVLLLNGKHQIINVLEITEGTVSSANPIIREIIAKVLQNFASSIICAHNHPSGDPEPSPEDKNFTKELKSASEIMQLNFLDHIIIGDNKYYSFADNGQFV